MKWIDQKIDEYGSKFYPTVGYNRYHEEAEWICTALKEAHQRGVEENETANLVVFRELVDKAVEEERKRVFERLLEWATTNGMGADLVYNILKRE